MLYFLFYRKLRPIKQNPPVDAHYAQTKMTAIAAALRRASRACWTHFYYKKNCYKI